MKHLLVLLIALCSSAYPAGAQTNASATPIAEGTSGSREQDGLSGPVRRVRVEIANVVTRDGKLVELPKSIIEVSTYDALGRKTDHVAYPVAGASAPGKESLSGGATSAGAGADSRLAATTHRGWLRDRCRCASYPSEEEILLRNS